MRSLIVGSVEEYPTEKAMRAELYTLLRKINPLSQTPTDCKFGTVIDRFIEEEQLIDIKAGRATTKGRLSFSTAQVYVVIINKYLRPQWAESDLEDIRPMLVQEWLSKIPVAQKTKANIKGLLHRLFDKAMFWEYIARGQNPIELVEVKGRAKRSKMPTVLTPEQFHEILSSLRDPQRTMVLLAQCTGLRVSEVLGLQWQDFNFDTRTFKVTRAVVRGRVDRLKTEYSEDLLPLDDGLTSALIEWRKRCPPSREGWIFPNPSTEKPYDAASVIKRHFRPLGEKIGIRFGWHSFRHTYRTWLDATGAPIGVQQKLMRHAQISTTMNVYGSAMMESKRRANTSVARLALHGSTGTPVGLQA
jgi:integrase